MRSHQQARRRTVCLCIVVALLLVISLWRLYASTQITGMHLQQGGKKVFARVPAVAADLSQPRRNTPLEAEIDGLTGGDVSVASVKSVLRQMKQQLEDLKLPLEKLNAKVDAVASAGSAIKEPHPKPVADRHVDHTGEETIFVNIASFRDDECPQTVKSMFEKARAPWRVFVGVVQQNSLTDLSCWPKEWSNCSKDGFCPSDQMRVREITPLEAKGPTYGRFLGHQMYRGEKYYFLMDSHNRFVTNWDDIIINMYKRAPSPKAVLSHYPEALLLDQGDSKPLDNRDTTTFMCNAKFIADGYLRFDGAVVHRTTVPRLQPFSAAGMLFADAKLIKEVPFDPHLPFLFDGEEFLYTVRMWTHGWDIYSPSENVMYHYYYRAKSPKVWSENNNWYHHQRRSVERVQYMLGSFRENTNERIVPENTTAEHITVELDKYGLGKDRTMEEYWKFSLADPVKRTVTSWCNRA
eukprot:PhM_4_TR244/c0_g1_i1/m.12367